MLMPQYERDLLERIVFTAVTAPLTTTVYGRNCLCSSRSIILIPRMTSKPVVDQDQRVHQLDATLTGTRQWAVLHWRRIISKVRILAACRILHAFQPTAESHTPADWRIFMQEISSPRSC